MATTKIWAIHDKLKRVLEYAANPDKTEYSALGRALHYAENEKKTFSGKEEVFLVTGLKCRAENAYEDMLAIQKQFGKTDRNLCYHAYQSFKPGEVTPEQCHEIGVKLANRLWSNKFQVLVATHLNTNHLHNHFVICSVSYRDGKKFEAKYQSYYEMRSTSDEICKAMGLSMIEKPKGKTPRNIYFAEKRGEPTKYNLIRDAINNALKISVAYRDFERSLREQGYRINNDPNRKYPTIYRYGDKKPVRLYQLGEKYEMDGIRATLDRNYYRYGGRFYERNFHQYSSEKRETQNYYYRGSFKKTKKITGFRAQYLYFCYLLGVLPKHKPHEPLSPQMKEEVRKMQQLSKQIELIVRYKLNDTNDANNLISRKQEEISYLKCQRDKCYNRLRRCNDPKEIAEIKSERDKLTEQISFLHGEIKTAHAVIDYSEKMHEMMKIEKKFIKIEREREIQTKKEKQKDIRFVR